MSVERCNQCGGAFHAATGLVPLLRCEGCGREVPAVALPRRDATGYVPLPVQCAGCDEPTPYEVGAERGTGSFGEWLATPLGLVFRRTHWDRVCVRASRERVGGKPTVPPVDAAEQLRLEAGNAS